MTKRTLGSIAVLCGGLMAAVGTLQAHHSLAGVYDMKAEKELTGSVQKVQFVNPHGSMSIMVKNPDASTTEWVFTLGSATALAGKQVGKIGPNALHVGDEIKVKCIPAKDGHPLGFLKSITYADGHTIVVSGGGPND